MTNTAQPGDIDALVSSVRDLVAHEKPVGRRRRRTRSELLILTQACRVDDDDAPAEYISVEEGDSAQSDEPQLASNVLRLNAAVQPERKTLEAKIAELEAAVTAQPEDWEPDEGEAFAPDAWAASAFQTPEVDSQKPDQSRAEMVAQLAREVEEAIGIGQPKPAPSPEMDMQAMRAMVVQIIREELAGELGEKITRNVRKLVRREINRVLASHDLD